MVVAVPVKFDPPPPESPSNSDALASTTGPFPGHHASFAQFSPQEFAASVLPSHASNAGDEFTFEHSLYLQDQPRYTVSQSIYEDNMISHPSSLLTNLSNHETSQSQPSIVGPSNFISGQSPRLIDLLLPGSDLNAPPDSIHYLSHHPEISYAYEEGSPLKQQDFEDDEDVEEVVRQEVPAAEEWAMPLPSPSPSSSSSSSNNTQSVAFNHLFNQPKLAANSSEMLLMGFNQNTCGILSVRDGPTENPWRMLVGPLVKEFPALYHAICSLSAFHASKHQPGMKTEGMSHGDRSVHLLATGLQHMRTDIALATTLVLAFAESWDVQVSSGRKYLEGAKALMDRADREHRQNIKSREDVLRLKFLYDTWVYMDVIARLTSVDNVRSDESDNWFIAESFSPRPFTSGSEIDPLMGCASTLFPYIGRVANLVRRVRKTASNSLNVISQANDLKIAIELWQPPSLFESPEDSTSPVQDSLQTAEAYRWATLLYLHQAVPEIPTLTAAQLANKILVYLATVKMSSRTVILHIFPLFVAGCEAEKAEDREWVEDRWRAMSQRMHIGNIDKCLDVTREVWDRRDKAHAAHSWARNRRSSSRILDEDIEEEKTVRGHLHWVRVMEEWKWESEWPSASF